MRSGTCATASTAWPRSTRAGRSTFIRTMRGMTNKAANEEPKWHHNGPALTTGYDPRWTGR